MRSTCPYGIYLELFGVQLGLSRTHVCLGRLLVGRAQLLLRSMAGPCHTSIMHVWNGSAIHAARGQGLRMLQLVCVMRACVHTAVPGQGTRHSMLAYAYAPRVLRARTSCFFWYRGARLRDSRSCTCDSSRLFASYRSRPRASAASMRSWAACSRNHTPAAPHRQLTHVFPSSQFHNTEQLVPQVAGAWSEQVHHHTNTDTHVYGPQAERS